MIKRIFEKIAPTHLAMDKDSIGLQIGTWNREVKKILTTLDINEQVVDEAVLLGVQMIYCHHAPLYKPIPNIIVDSPQGRMIEKLIKNDISVYVAHTNLDIVHGGVNDVLAQTLELEDLDVLVPTNHDKLKKLTVFVPLSHKDIVLRAISEAGAGWIGNYSHCTFSVQGTGTFMPQEGTKPFIGAQGKLEEMNEVRIETILPESIQKTVIDAMVAAHPYEEVAYDIYPLDNKGKEYGIGRIGHYTLPIDKSIFLEKVKNKLSLASVQFVDCSKEKIQKVAVCGGSGSRFLSVAKKLQADAYVTGDITYHDAQWAAENDLMLINAGHYQTESLVVHTVTSLLNKEFMKNNIEIDTIASKLNTNPFKQQ